MNHQSKPVSRLGDRSWPSRAPAVTASANVLVNRKPVLRVGDAGSNRWEAVAGAPHVLVNGRNLHRLKDAHSASESCEGSPNVICGEVDSSGHGVKGTCDILVQLLVKETLVPIPQVPVSVDFVVGPTEHGVTDALGLVRLIGAPCGKTRITYHSWFKILEQHFEKAPRSAPAKPPKYAPPHPKAPLERDPAIFVDPCESKTFDKTAMEILKAETQTVFDEAYGVGTEGPATEEHNKDASEESTAAPSVPALIVLVEPAVPYYSVLNQNKHHFQQERLCDRQTVDLKKDDKDTSFPFRWISDLQEDLVSFGYKRAVRNDDGTDGQASGIFDHKLEETIKSFQHAATRKNRRTPSGLREVEKTFDGEVNGVVDDKTKEEIKIWADNRYRRVLRPFDPKGLMANTLYSTQFVARINGLVALLDDYDLELYGPNNADATVRTVAQQDAIFRNGKTHARGGKSWHNYGLAADLYFYKSDDDLPSDDDNKMPGEKECFGRIAVPQAELEWGPAVDPATGSLYTFAGDRSHVQFRPNGLTTGERALRIYNSAPAGATELQKLQLVWAGPRQN